MDMRYARKCSECGHGTNEAFVVEGGMAYYCTEKCLKKHIKWSTWLKLYADGDGDSYWTEYFEDDIDDVWYDYNGNECHE